MPWIRRKLRGSRVYVKSDASGAPERDPSGRVEIRYQLSPTAKVYRAAVRNLEPTGDPADEQPIEADMAAPPPPREVPPRTAKGAEENAIVIYTDGACTGNPGPMGIGVVIKDGDRCDEISEFLGQGTNNIAELTAIMRALEAIPRRDRARPLILHSDSSYSLGLLTKGWKAKANVDLVARLRRLVAEFPRIRFVKVRGHAGVPENERCDELGRAAIARGR
jgi:ribonuclease HI